VALKQFTARVSRVGRGLGLGLVLAFHDTDTDILATIILARMSARMSVSVFSVGVVECGLNDADTYANNESYISTKSASWITVNHICRL